jgi:hypothetical protein
MAVPAVIRYGFGFVQGADDAAVELGVDLASCGSKGAIDSGAIGALVEVCRKEIQENENRDAEESSRREHRKISHL